MLTSRGYVGHVLPAVAVEHLGLRDQLAVGLASGHHDLVAHHRRGRRGARMVEPRQVLPRTVPQRKDPIGLPRGQLLAGHEAADHHGLPVVRHGREMVQRQREPGPGGPPVGGRVVDLRGRAGRPDADPAEDPQLAVHCRRGRVLTPERRIADGPPVEVRREPGSGDGVPPAELGSSSSPDPPRRRNRGYGQSDGDRGERDEDARIRPSPGRRRRRRGRRGRRVAGGSATGRPGPPAPRDSRILPRARRGLARHLAVHGRDGGSRWLGRVRGPRDEDVVLGRRPVARPHGLPGDRRAGTWPPARWPPGRPRRRARRPWSSAGRGPWRWRARRRRRRP